MVKKQTNPEPPAPEIPQVKPVERKWPAILSWIGTLFLVAVMLAILFRFKPLRSNEPASAQPVGTTVSSNIPLPALSDNEGEGYALVRTANIDTIIPEGQRQFPVQYTIVEGDSIFAIAEKFDLKPESILWANYDLLNDDPTYLAVGWKLTIPPTNGIYYKWKDGDSLEKVAEKYRATISDIISWPSNKLDVTAPDTTGIEYVMIPGGSREIKSWIVPLAYTSGSGATRIIAGPGGCQAPETGPIGSMAFISPTGGYGVSGFDFTGYHLAIDLGAMEGTPIYASDSGTVIYAGWNDSGYGNLVVISHRNGYETLYAHLSNIYVYCGQGVMRGEAIAAAGNTGKSTGSHLHFEVRLNGAFVNPWSVLGY